MEASISSPHVSKPTASCEVRFGYLHAALHGRQMRDLDAEQAEWEARGYNHFTRLEGQDAMSAHIGSTAYVGALHDDTAAAISSR